MDKMLFLYTFSGLRSEFGGVGFYFFFTFLLFFTFFIAFFPLIFYFHIYFPSSYILGTSYSFHSSIHQDLPLLWFFPCSFLVWFGSSRAVSASAGDWSSCYCTKYQLSTVLHPTLSTYLLCKRTRLFYSVLMLLFR